MVNTVYIKKVTASFNVPGVPPKLYYNSLHTSVPEPPVHKHFVKTIRTSISVPKAHTASCVIGTSHYSEQRPSFSTSQDA